MRRLIQFCGAVVLLSAGTYEASRLVPLHAQTTDPWVARSTKLQFDRLRAADAPLQIDVPKKDWMALPSSPSALVVLASRKGDALVLVERSSLRAALDPSSITAVFAQLEIDGILEQQPKATEFLSRVLDTGQRKLVAVQYARPGVLGSERVRQDRCRWARCSTTSSASAARRSSPRTIPCSRISPARSR